MFFFLPIKALNGCVVLMFFEFLIKKNYSKLIIYKLLFTYRYFI